jgi:uncharacterized integral membrane protein
MKYFKIFSFLVIAIMLVAFAVQNAALITVKLLFWQFEVSTALLILICFALGAVVMLFFTVPVFMKNQRKGKSMGAANPEAGHPG